MSDHSLAKYDKFFRYTTGRWLWDEEKQLQDRFTPFNVLELQRIAAESIGANKCVAMTKLAEGSFNKTFHLKMDNGSTVIARIPHPIAGPKYGNLYYSGEAVPGAVVAEVVNDTSPELKMDVKTRFSIGPVVARDFWTKERSAMDIDRGPWHLPHEYAVALARREQQWIEKYAIPKPANDQLITSTAQNSPEAHLSLLKQYLQVAPYLLPADDPNLVASTIWHTDLHAGNLFVDKGRITSVIDWQEAWAGPLVLQGRHPRLVDYQGDIILRPPPNFKDLELNEKARLKKQIASSIILYLYEQQTAKLNPNLNRVLRLKLGRVRCEPISFVGDTWDDDILPLRESLIKVESHWHELGFNFACPIHFTQDELQRHTEDGEGWNEVQDFWGAVEGIVARDGWTPHSMYDEAVALFSELREFGLKNLIGKERKDFEAQTRAQGKTGIRVFMAVGVLYGEKHCFMHDLESFFWVLFWICIRYDGLGKGSTLEQFEKWNYMGTEELVAAKQEVIKRRCKPGSTTCYSLLNLSIYFQQTKMRQDRERFKFKVSSYLLLLNLLS
ncbi:phosphotransferase enzyme family protein [Histoplasma capsulatum var. duboisii H88]|uniref:Altered inheritance of mitochondria protein 9, mitochondrial n=1 Tax=Ajellomyces capsulatus (strain H88) TaxID=544711 RepID=F0USJ2_AJEC8|nr:phosphotransferase enzyme family protein [Histoplasma capsulatum var. duboisii H88]